jgi:hypothetical protein
MSGATISGAGAPDAGKYVDAVAPRAPFGTRRNEAGLTILSSRSMDCGVADMRRRIDATAPPPRRLPFAVAAVVIAGLSVAIWLNTFEVASTLVRYLSRQF